MSAFNPFRAVRITLQIALTILLTALFLAFIVVAIVAAVEDLGGAALLIPVTIIALFGIAVGVTKLGELISRAWRRAERRWDTKRRKTVPTAELIPEFQPAGELA